MSERPTARARALPLRAALCLGALLSAAPAQRVSGTEDRLDLSSDLRVVVRDGRELSLELRAAAGDSYETLAARAMGRASGAAALAERMRGAPVVAGAWVDVPLGLLRLELRSFVLRRLFPQDRHDGRDWLHTARAGERATYAEGVWQVAEWFARGGEDFAALMKANELSSPELRVGQVLRIPAALLHPALVVRPRSDDGALEYGTDTAGPFAAYRLQAGQALYSAVVMRFTGRTDADDVRQVASQLAARSEVRALQDIPVGFEIKIPFELLEPEFLPRDDPRRRENEARLQALESALAKKPVPATRGGLEGVIVILDPGHGGRDLGTMNNGIWEHDYVYDVACRLKQLLEHGSAARVVMTLKDKETGWAPSSGDKLVANRQGTILTTPAFLVREEGESDVGVNLRWYLANSVFRAAVGSGTSGDRVVFLSLHADSRHPSLRGLMVYVPGTSYRTRTHGSTAAEYRRFREVREQPTIRFDRDDCMRSEAVSRGLAQAIVKSFGQSGLPVQPYQPVRDKVIRGKERWLPAVLRGNAVPAKVLVEMLNLSNVEDARLLASAKRRDQIARALESAIHGYFGERPKRATPSAR